MWTGTNQELTILFAFQGLDSWLRTDISELWMRDSSELWFHVFHKFLLVLFFFDFNYRSILLSQLKSFFIKVDQRMQRFDNLRETADHTIMTHIFMAIRTIFVRKLKSHLYFEQFLFFGRLIFPEISFIKRKSNNYSLDKCTFFIHFLVVFNRFIWL